MSTCGLRVLGFASAERPRNQPLASGQLVWLGMIGMADPVRPGIADVLRDFHDAGIRTVMVTGDQALTAASIAREVRLSPTMRIIDGLTFLDGNAEEVAERAGQFDVFARVSPTHKLDIVQALQNGGLTVAMTGDGTNDAPALRAADIGVAMGRHGTSAAREIADIVLAEDNLNTMVVAVRQGRTIYANMRKAIHFLVSTNSSEVFVTLGAAAGGLGQPLSAGQLLWLNPVTGCRNCLFAGVRAGGIRCHAAPGTTPRRKHHPPQRLRKAGIEERSVQPQRPVYTPLRNGPLRGCGRRYSV
jgi:Ca2+-transporting ATPase